MTESILQPWIDKGLVDEPPLILEDGTINPEAEPEDFAQTMRDDWSY